MRNIGIKSLDQNIKTNGNFNKFAGAGYYTGKARGRRDLDHMKETILGSPNLVFPYGSKLYTCFNELLADGIVLVNCFNESSHYMSHNREQAIIFYLGLNNLTNVYNGTTYGSFKFNSSF